MGKLIFEVVAVGVMVLELCTSNGRRHAIISGDWTGTSSLGHLFLQKTNQVEVIKGASSTLYGSSALNGVSTFEQLSLEMNLKRS